MESEKIKLEIAKTLQKMMNQQQYRAYKVKVTQIQRDLKISNQNFTRSDVDPTAKMGGWNLDSDKSSLETEEDHNRFTKFVIRNIVPSADRSCSSSLNGSDPEQMSEQLG